MLTEPIFREVYTTQIRRCILHVMQTQFQSEIIHRLYSLIAHYCHIVMKSLDYYYFRLSCNYYHLNDQLK